LSTFSDDFNRADGGIGNNWQYFNASAAISGNKLVCPQYAYNYHPSINASGRHEVTLSFHCASAELLGAGALLKFSSTGPSGYVCPITGYPSTPVYHIKRLTSGSYVTDYTVDGGALADGWHTQRVVYYNGIITMWIDGELMAQTADSTHGALTGAGIHSWVANTQVDDFSFIGDEDLAFTVTPSVIGNYSNSTTVTFTGVATAWTSGTPGAPTFTVDHGTLIDQVIASATSATATYTPGSFLGIATFADPSTGATDQVTVTSDPGSVPPPSTGLSSDVIAYLERSAGAETNATIANREMTVGEAGAYVDFKTAVTDLRLGAYKNTYEVESQASTAKLLYILFGLVSGYHPPREGVFTASSDSTLKEDNDFFRERWEDSGHVSPWTIEQIRDALAGDPPASHQDIITAINGIGGGSNQDVLDAIAAMQGDPLATIKAVLDLVYLLDPTGTHNLAELLTAIGGVRGAGAPDLAAVISRLAQIQPTTANSLDDILTKVISSTAMEALLDLAVGAIIGPEAVTLTTITSLLDTILSAVQGFTATVPPVWIDEAHATVESSVALADALELTGPLDGVIVSITDHPSGAGKFAFGDQRSWRYVGAVVFQNDRGDWEWAQPIGLEAQLITPRTMQHASAARFRVESGWQGTVRAFTVTAGA